MLLLAIAAVVHFLMAAASTTAIKDYPLATSLRKNMWLLATWLLPIAGPMMAGRWIKIGKASGKWPHGEHIGAIGPDDDPHHYEGHARSAHDHDQSGHHDSHDNSGT